MTLTATLVAGCAGAEVSPSNAEASSAACGQDYDLAGPGVSLENELMPFFSTTCAFGGCHDGNTKQAGLYLGPNFLDGPASSAARREVHASLLGRSTTAPSLYRVKPTDPRESFVMIKVQGCQNLMGLACGGAVRGKPCGDRMPALSNELPSDKKNLLARWIAQGALDSASDGGSGGARDGAVDGAP